MDLVTECQHRKQGSVCEIWGGVLITVLLSDSGLLRCDAVLLSEWFPAFYFFSWGCLILADEGTAILRKATKHSPDDVVVTPQKRGLSRFSMSFDFLKTKFFFCLLFIVRRYNCILKLA